MSSNILKAQLQSIQAKLKNTAAQHGANYQEMLTLFLLERAAVRLLGDVNLQNNLIFKGGYVGVRVYNSPRYTTDLELLSVEWTLRTLLSVLKPPWTLIREMALGFNMRERKILKPKEIMVGSGFPFVAE